MATKIERDTAKLMLSKLQSRLDDLYQEQESLKATEEMKRGGKVGLRKMYGGGTSGDDNTSLYNSLTNSPGQWLQLGNIMGANIDPISPRIDVPEIDTTSLTSDLVGTNAGGGFGDRYGASDFKPAGGGFDWGNLAYGIGTAAPVIYNAIQGLRQPEQEQAQDFYNPMAGQALNRLGKMRYDINPQLQANKAGQQTYNRNAISASGGNRGQLLGNLNAGLTNRQGADAQAYSQASNINNQYQQNLAQAELGVGNQMAQTNMQVADWNARNRAGRRNYMGQAASDLSGMLQTNRLMGNQQTRDEQRMELYPDIFPTVSQFMPWLQNFNVNPNTN